MPSSRSTQRAVDDIATLETARAAAGATPTGVSGAGSADAVTGGLRRAGLLALLVLHLLEEGPSYGNALMDRIATLTGGLLPVNPNTMYPLLRRLEAEGYIEGTWEHPERRSRRFYALTDAGQARRGALVDQVVPRIDGMVATLRTLRDELGP